jgi:hypothetical protein
MQPLGDTAIWKAQSDGPTKEVGFKKTLTEKINKVAIGNILIITAILAFYGCIAAAIFVNPLIAIGAAASILIAVLGNKLRDDKPSSPSSDSEGDFSPPPSPKPPPSVNPSQAISSLKPKVDSGKKRADSAPRSFISRLTSSAAPLSSVAPRGIDNWTGSDCWINSMIQLLSNIPEFVDEIRHIPGDLYQLILDHVDKKSIVSKDARGILRSAGIQFDGPGITGQQDAALILEYLEGLTPPQRMKAKFRNIDQTLETARTDDSQKFSISLGIPIDTRKVLKLQNMFDDTFSSEVDSQNASDFGHVKYYYSKVPNNIVLHVRRFQFRTKRVDGKNVLGKKIKCENLIDHNNGLLVLKKGNYSITEEGSDLQYDCRGFVHHRGNLNGGHYVTYVKKANSGFEYFCCSDSSIRSISQDEYLDKMKEAYIMHFERVDSESREA